MIKCKTIFGNQKNCRSSSGSWQNGVSSWEGFPLADTPKKVAHYRRLPEFHALSLVTFDLSSLFLYMSSYMFLIDYSDENVHFDASCQRLIVKSFDIPSYIVICHSCNSEAVHWTAASRLHLGHLLSSLGGTNFHFWPRGAIAHCY